MFGYDEVNRLESVTGSTTESYLFDDVGNRTSSHRASSYGYQSGQFNRLTSAVTPSQTLTYGFDANGNMKTKGEGSNFWRYSWDYENRMTEAATRKQKVRYRYDALGRRVTRNLGGGREITKFTYDGNDVLVDDNFGTQTKYLNGEGIDNKLRSTIGSTASYFLSDHLGSTNGLANSSGSLTSSSSYDSFGNPTNPGFSSRYQFTGREYDNFTGLQFSRARFYDPNLGRFISEDPIGFNGGDANLYGYVKNNPPNFKDPTGLIDLGWGSPTGPKIPYSHLPPSPPVYDHYFGDGGILTQQTFSELRSGKERSKRNCKSTWFQRFRNNFEVTNAALPGLGAPSIFPGLGLGALTSGATADGLQTMTFMQWARSGFGGSVSGAATFTASETAIGVAVGSAANALVVTAAYEGGVVIGSAANASNGYRDYCPCGE